MIRISAYKGHCHDCRRQTLLTRKIANRWLHRGLTLLTFGLWLLVGGWRCSECGSRSIRPKSI